MLQIPKDVLCTLSVPAFDPPINIADTLQITGCACLAVPMMLLSSSCKTATPHTTCAYYDHTFVHQYIPLQNATSSLKDRFLPHQREIHPTPRDHLVRFQCADTCAHPSFTRGHSLPHCSYFRLVPFIYNPSWMYSTWKNCLSRRATFCSMTT